MGTSYTIARIRNQEYTSGLAELKRDLGIDMVINPENATAVEISRLLRFPSAANIETFCRGPGVADGLPPDGGRLSVGNPLQDLSSQVKKLSLLFCAVDRDGEVIIPNGSFVPQAGDNLYLIGRPTGLDQFFRLLGRYTPKVRRVFLVGGGKISLYLAILLEKMQMQVKIVELSEARCRFLSELLPHSTIICGDGTDQELLDSENLSSCDAFVALTDGMKTTSSSPCTPPSWAFPKSSPNPTGRTTTVSPRPLVWTASSLPSSWPPPTFSRWSGGCRTPRAA